MRFRTGQANVCSWTELLLYVNWPVTAACRKQLAENNGQGWVYVIRLLKQVGVLFRAKPRTHSDLTGHADKIFLKNVWSITVYIIHHRVFPKTSQSNRRELTLAGNSDPHSVWKLFSLSAVFSGQRSKPKSWSLIRQIVCREINR